MMDWNLVVKMAGGGFGMVFIILAILGGAIWLTKIVTARIVKGKPKK